MKLINIGLASLLFLFIINCGGGGGSSNPPITPPANMIPTANAGEDKSVTEQSDTELTGIGSDSDGSISAYSWTQISGESVEISDATMATARITTPITIEPLDLEFDLTVTDNDSASHTDRVVITVLPVNTLPEIDFRGSTEVLETQSTTWRVETFDVDGSVEEILWEQLSGPDVGLLPEQVTTNRVDLDIPSLITSATATFKLTITDNEQGVTEEDIELLIEDSHEIERTNRLTDTGNTRCGNYAESTEPDDIHDNSVECHLTESPDNYPVPDGQDGHYGLDVTQPSDADGLAGFRYVKLDNFGDVLPDDSETWSCILDQVTGLIWEVKHEGPEITADHNRFAWFNDDPLVNGGDEGSEADTVGCAYTDLNCNTSNYITSFNSESRCGTTEMRLPTPKELMGLVSLKQGDTGTKVDTVFFPFLHTGNARYWTSITSATTPERAFLVDFSTAKLITEQKSNTEGVLLVHHYEP